MSGPDVYFCNGYQQKYMALFNRNGLILAGYVDLLYLNVLHKFQRKDSLLTA